MKWQGKTWATLGDSITEANGYQPLVRAALGFAEVANRGRNGCPMTAGGDTDEGSTVKVGAGLRRFDCVTVFAGVNDFRLSKPLGAPGDTDIHTFYGAYATLIEGILKAFPACRLNLWTPLHRDKDGYDVNTRNGDGRRLDDYAEAVRSLGMRYALPVLDLYRESGIHALTLPLFTSDGLHPNEAGHARIAGMAASFLERL